MQIELGQSKPSGNPSTVGLSPNLTNHLSDYLSNPQHVENMRRAVRSWFVAYLPTGDERMGPFDLQGNVTAFEIVDELLCSIVQLPALTTTITDECVD